VEILIFNVLSQEAVPTLVKILIVLTLVLLEIIL
jgi:hypothetical protein